ncbi:MAG TPA: rod shape-determining protein MreD [Jatrophihabitantaceae bacterium]
MTPTRVAAATAAVLTALLLQATVVGPAAMTAQLSLPAVFVAAVALESGAGTGITLGFAAGLVADLGSSHAAGLLALCWLGLGLGCGLLADTYRGVLPQIVMAALASTAAIAVTTLGLTAVGEPGGTLLATVRGLLPSLLGEFVLAALVVPLTRRFLRSNALQVVGHG